MATASRPWEADVVVIGGGLAGFSASIEAAQAGAEVLMLEKQPEVGGSLNKCIASARSLRP